MKEKSEKIIYACMEHVEQAIDDYVNFLEVPPQLIKTNEEQQCTYCPQNAEYIIMK